MKKKKIFHLLVVSLNIAIIQSCDLKRVDPPCPTVTSLSPAAARLGDTVTIIGENFKEGFPRLYKVSIGDTILSDNDIIGVSATSLRFKVPKGIGSGSLKVGLAGSSNCTSQGKEFIYRYIVKSGNIISPFAGQTGNTNCDKCFSFPQGLDVDANGDIIVADRNHHVIKKIDAATQNPFILAGIKDSPGYLNNPRLSAKFKNPTDVAVSATGDIYVADRNNNCIRKITGNDVVTLTGNPADLNTYKDAALLDARFEAPTGIATNGTNFIMITEPGKKRFRFIDNTQVKTLPPNNQGNPFTFPYGVAFSDQRASARKDEFKMFIADPGSVQFIKGLNQVGDLTTIPTSFINQPYDLAFDKAGNLFVLDRGRNQIFVIYTNNSFDVLAGNGINGTVFQLASGIAINKAKKLLYVSDEQAHTIVQIKFE